MTDLRQVLCNQTAVQHDHYAIAYKTKFGEIRVIPWLTFADAVDRRNALLKRGYRVELGPMDIAQ